MRRRHARGRVVPAVGHAVRLRLGAGPLARAYAGVFVALHGSAYSTPSWKGAAIVWAPTNPTTRAPTEDWQTFQGGFGFGGTVLDCPTDLAFAPDGRMFFADDSAGAIYWMAPLTLMAPDATPAP